MSTRLRSRVVRRPSLPLTAQDEADLASIRSSAVLQRALQELSRTGDSPAAEVSESALLHAIFEVGLEAIQAAVQEAGYAELAEQRAPDAVEHRAAARRRRPAWADEA